MTASEVKSEPCQTLISIAAVDGVSKVLTHIGKGFKKTSAEIEKLWNEGKKLDAKKKSRTKIAFRKTL